MLRHKPGGRCVYDKAAKAEFVELCLQPGILYSLLQTCRVNGIDGYRYLRALFAALPQAQTADDYAALLPWRMALTDPRG